MERQNIKNDDIGKLCTLVLKRTDGKVDFQTGTFLGESETHFRLKMTNGHETLYLRQDVQKVEFAGCSQ